jgi:protein-disulfide isomerase
MKYALRSLLAVSVFSLAACSQAGATDLTKSDIEEIVRAYILENPEILREAQIALAQKEAEAEVEQSKQAIADLSDQLLRDPRDYSVGPTDAKVQLVEFFDYNCGFCKRSTDLMESVISKYPDDVRVVFKEVPVLTGPEGTSHIAARAALAAARQGKYQKFHFALMSQRSLTEDRILEIASAEGLNVEQLERDMADPSIRRQIIDNLQLTDSIPAFTGTPFFIINDEYVSGADLDRVQSLLDEALEG